MLAKSKPLLISAQPSIRFYISYNFYTCRRPHINHQSLVGVLEIPFVAASGAVSISFSSIPVSPVIRKFLAPDTCKKRRFRINEGSVFIMRHHPCYGTHVQKGLSHRDSLSVSTKGQRVLRKSERCVPQEGPKGDNLAKLREEMKTFENLEQSGGPIGSCSRNESQEENQ